MTVKSKMILPLEVSRAIRMMSDFLERDTWSCVDTFSLSAAFTDGKQ